MVKKISLDSKLQLKKLTLTNVKTKYGARGYSDLHLLFWELQVTSIEIFGKMYKFWAIYSNNASLVQKIGYYYLKIVVLLIF